MSISAYAQLTIIDALNCAVNAVSSAQLQLVKNIHGSKSALVTTFYCIQDRSNGLIEALKSLLTSHESITLTLGKYSSTYSQNILL